jgi:structural maintenance of chromosome 1
MAKQSGRLHRLEVENWKSYGGRQVIGPFSDFTAVIGPNGAGKSNLMDAVSFAVGLQSKDLRGRQLKDLIYRADGDSDAEERRASVTLVYERDGRETKFQRCISSQGTGEYRIDSKLVSYDTYASRLQDLGVLASAHTGFLVFQGYVSELANKSPSELTALFEKISGSEELKAEDERLAKEKKAAEDDQQYNFNKKRALGQERNNMKKQKEEAEKYSGLLGKVDELKQRLFLLRLFGIEVEVTSLHAELTGQREELETATARQSAVEEAVKANEKEKSSIARERGEAERKVWHPSPPLKLPRVLSHFLLVFLSSGFPPPFSHSHRLSATAPFVAGRPAAEADRWQRADLDSIARGNHPHREEKGRRSEGA